MAPLSHTLSNVKSPFWSQYRIILIIWTMKQYLAISQTRWENKNHTAVFEQFEIILCIHLTQSVTKSNFDIFCNLLLKWKAAVKVECCRNVKIKARLLYNMKLQLNFHQFDWNLVQTVDRYHGLMSNLALSATSLWVCTSRSYVKVLSVPGAHLELKLKSNPFPPQNTTGQQLTHKDKSLNWGILGEELPKNGIIPLVN